VVFLFVLIKSCVIASSGGVITLMVCFAHVKVRVDTPGLLTNSDFSRFSIEWRNGHLKVKKNGTLLIEWQDPSPFGISHFGVRTAWGAQGHWRVKTFDPSAPPGIV
jgi:hypothetical protein